MLHILLKFYGCPFYIKILYSNIIIKLNSYFISLNF